MTRRPYSCERAKTDLGTLLDLLRREHVLAEDAYAQHVESFFVGCEQCDKGLAAKHCRGWCISIDSAHALVFEPATYKARLVRPLIHGMCDFGRSLSGDADLWETAPLKHSTVAVLLFEGVEIDQPSERHHLDLCNEQQPGPVWHLQLGGNPSGYDKFATSWLAPPRWPVAPADFILMAEAVVFNFYRAAFEKLNQNGAWVRIVKSAEDLVLTHYRQHMERHFAPGSGRTSTWLAAQDNESGALAPRPA